MLDRIKALIAARQLSSSQFADLTALPRPVVSHILSGRNKPSLDVAQKIMAAFPDVSVDWLLNGRGPMVSTPPPTAEAALDPASAPTIAPPGPAASSPPASAPAPARARAVTTGAQPPADVARPVARADKLATAPIAPQSALASPEPAAAVASPPAISAAAPAALPTALPAAPPAPLSPPPPAVVQQVIRPERAVRRILVFYSDGTFSDHRPLPPEESPFF